MDNAMKTPRSRLTFTMLNQCVKNSICKQQTFDQTQLNNELGQQIFKDLALPYSRRYGASGCSIRGAGQGREGQARFDQLAEEYPDATIGILGIPWDIPEENWKIHGKHPQAYHGIPKSEV